MVYVHNRPHYFKQFSQAAFFLVRARCCLFALSHSRVGRLLASLALVREISQTLLIISFDGAYTDMFRQLDQFSVEAQFQAEGTAKQDGDSDALGGSDWQNPLNVLMLAHPQQVRFGDLRWVSCTQPSLRACFPASGPA